MREKSEPDRRCLDPAAIESESETSKMKHDLGMHDSSSTRLFQCLRLQCFGAIVLCAVAVMVVVRAAPHVVAVPPMANGSFSSTRALMTEARNDDNDEIFTVETFNNYMVFDGLPFVINITLVANTNVTGNRTWTTITSQHILSYWQEGNYGDFNITRVVTNLFQQFPEPTSDDSSVLQTRVIYDQQIRYLSTGTDSPVNDTDDASVLFTEPFQPNNTQPYVDELTKAFELSSEIQLLEMGLAAPPSPPPSSMPTMAPITSNSDGRTVGTLLILWITLANVAVMGAF